MTKVVVVVSHIQRMDSQPEEKLLYTVANPARGLLDREKRNRKSLAAQSPPRARCSFEAKK